MTVKDLIKLSADLLGKEDLYDYLNGGASTDVVRHEKEKQLLLRCANIVFSELSNDFLPVKNVETFLARDGKIYFRDFSKTPIEILNAYALNGKQVEFDLYAEYLSTDQSSLTVEYTYTPKILSEDENLPAVFYLLTLTTIAYGVVAEFACINGMAEKATFFRERFSQAIEKSLGLKNFNLKQRRWM